ncbi:VTT domain-containing protein [Limnobacter humi]|uniref:TVP38/TMEM64 family membrane protein n=1 Tax=Limnobacter humi TaxID=1778671 RepID=A0ABT1WCF9_9BURK|nr:VTT domain-containing protein [Limnobacter humi]MCQ8895064.1 VTT domain-containing protein [Limnobacter humi]
MDTGILLEWAHWLSLWFESHPWQAALAYTTVFTAITALCLPGAAVLMVLGSLCMGSNLCFGLSLTASTLGAWLTFLACRHWLKPVMVQRHAQRLNRFSAAIHRHEAATLLSLRLAPAIPFVLFNVLCGLGNTRSATFLWTSIVGMAPGTWLYVKAGHELGQLTGWQDALAPELLLTLLALALMPWLGVWLNKRLQLTRTGGHPTV